MTTKKMGRPETGVYGLTKDGKINIPPSVGDQLDLNEQYVVELRDDGISFLKRNDGPVRVDVQERDQKDSDGVPDLAYKMPIAKDIRNKVQGRKFKVSRTKSGLKFKFA